MGDLYPNGDGDSDAPNPQPEPLRGHDHGCDRQLGDVTASGGIGTCVLTGVSFNDQHGLTIHVPPNSDSDTVELNNAAHMSNESENGCQGAVFTIPVVLSGASSDEVSPT